MTTLARVLGLLAVLTTSASVARAQYPQRREGFWIGFGLGYGSANVTCDGCGTPSEVATARVFGGTMGAIFRCVHCDFVMIRLAKTPTGYFLDMQGARQIFVAS